MPTPLFENPTVMFPSLPYLNLDPESGEVGGLDCFSDNENVNDKAFSSACAGPPSGRVVQVTSNGRFTPR